MITFRIVLDTANDTTTELEFLPTEFGVCNSVFACLAIRSDTISVALYCVSGKNKVLICIGEEFKEANRNNQIIRGPFQ